jgi:hypothetical protein
MFRAASRKIPLPIARIVHDTAALLEARIPPIWFSPVPLHSVP